VRSKQARTRTPGDLVFGRVSFENNRNIDVLLLEIGNTTIKLARPLGDDTFMLERFASADELLRRIERLDGDIVCAPVGAPLSGRLVDRLAKRGATIVTSATLAGFIGSSYDTPETLGVDRVLNLLGLDHDAVVISCGTAITVDARIGGRPVWGAIMPGFTTAAAGLHHRIPALPLVEITREPRLPARTSVDSVTNGVLIGTARAAQGLADELARAIPSRPDFPIGLTGGDAQILERLWASATAMPIVDEMLVFTGMVKSRASDGTGG